MYNYFSASGRHVPTKNWKLEIRLRMLDMEMEMCGVWRWRGSWSPAVAEKEQIIRHYLEQPCSMLMTAIPDVAILAFHLLAILFQFICQMAPTSIVQGRDHSFGILCKATGFACFHGISTFSQNFAEFGTGLVRGENMAYFGQVQGLSKNNCYIWKICHSEPRNVAKLACRIWKNLPRNTMVQGVYEWTISILVKI